MSKELEALEKLTNNTLTDEERKLYKDIIEVNLEMYEELKTKAMQTELELDEKETMLNIIIKKEVNIHLLKTSTGRIHYNWLIEDPNLWLTIREYNSLKKEASKYGKI